MAYSFQQGLVVMPPKRDPERRLMLLAVEEIKQNPNQPRRSFDSEALSELMVSIAQVGLIQPLTVRQTEDGYELVAGERRLRACKLLGYREVPCVIQTMSEEKSAYMALIENVQRSDLHYLEEAQSYETLLHTFDLTQEALATRLGKSQSFLSNKLRLLKLSPDVQSRLIALSLSERHARALLRLTDERLQLRCLEQIEKKKLSITATERMVDALLVKQGRAPIRVLRFSRDCRLFVNSVKNCMEQLNGTGMCATMEEKNRPDGVDLVIHVQVPK